MSEIFRKKKTTLVVLQVRSKGPDKILDPLDMVNKTIGKKQKLYVFSEGIKTPRTLSSQTFTNQGLR